MPDEPVNPGNPYGASKAAGERLAAEAFAGRSGATLGIARTAWLFGRPGTDFPSRILDNAERAAAAGQPLRVVNDEWGTPTYTADVADAIVELLSEDATAGIHHLVNGLFGTRADWARYTVGRAGIDVEVVDVPASTWERPSRPPRWGVLEPTPLPSGEPMRPWPNAMADYAPALLRARRVRA
jgi:dTDP-4-dehydrorhamnose reductase